MVTAELASERAQNIATLIEEKFGVKGGSLEAKLNRAGRLLPKWLRQEASVLVDAERLSGHPKLMMQADPEALNQAHSRCAKWLNSVDPAERRKDRILSILATTAFNLLLFGALLVTVLVLTGVV